MLKLKPRAPSVRWKVSKHPRTPKSTGTHLRFPSPSLEHLKDIWYRSHRPPWDATVLHSGPGRPQIISHGFHGHPFLWGASSGKMFSTSCLRYYGVKIKRLLSFASETSCKCFENICRQVWFGLALTFPLCIFIPEKGDWSLDAPRLPEEPDSCHVSPLHHPVPQANRPCLVVTDSTVLVRRWGQSKAGDRPSLLQGSSECV